jgi:hypothetical protein
VRKIRVPGSTGLYDADKDLERIQEKLATICYIVGLDGSMLEEMTVDEIMESLRKSFYYMSSKEELHQNAAASWVHQCNYHLTMNLRKYWWHRQLANGAKTRG